MAKELKPIIINNFQRGIAPSSYLGFEEIRNLNITDKPGICYPHKALTKESSTTVTDILRKMVKDSEGDVWGYGTEEGNDVFKRDGGSWELHEGGAANQHTDAGIDGMFFWKGYVGVIISGTIDWYDITTDQADTSWGASDITDSGSNPHPAIHSRNDDNVYLGANNVIDSIAEGASGFTPDGGTPAAYIVTKAALDLPEQYTITNLEELGEKLMIGTSKTGNDLEATIFPWDRSSSSFDTPIVIKDESIVNMITVNNLLYVQCGGRGNWYVTNGVSVEKIGQIPITLVDLSSIQLDRATGREAVCYMNDLIYFGVSYNSGSIECLGVWSLNPKNGAFNFEYTISPGEYGQTASKAVYIGALMPLGGATPNLLVSWFDDNGSAYGVDDIGSNRYTDDKAFLISQFYRAGFVLNKRPLHTWEVQLAKPMASGDSVKLYYRTAQNGTWKNVVDDVTESTTAASNAAFMSYAVEGAIQSFRRDRVIEAENIQVKCVLNDEAELLEISIT